MPLAIFFVSSVTRTTTFSRVPFVSVSRYSQRVPTGIGKYGLSIFVVKSAGSS